MSNLTNHVELAAEIVAAYVSRNSVPSGELPNLLNDVHGALVRTVGAMHVRPVEIEPLKPMVNPKKSITHDFIICLEDGRRFKSLKRHLSSKYNLTPEQYRRRWGLDADYPMVSPAYAAARSSLAKQMGLGLKKGN